MTNCFVASMLTLSLACWSSPCFGSGCVGRGFSVIQTASACLFGAKLTWQQGEDHDHLTEQGKIFYCVSTQADLSPVPQFTMGNEV